jgi:hypothetical protein
MRRRAVSPPSGVVRLSRPEPRRRLLIASGVIGLALAAAACGGSSPNSGIASLDTTTTTTPTTAAAASDEPAGGELVEFATCMRSHGVSSFPDSASFGSSAALRVAKGQIAQITNSEGSTPTFEAAARDCSKYAPTTAPPQHVSAQEIRKLLAVSRCMRAHGVPNFADPDPTTGALITPAGLDKNAPQVVAALEACSALGKAAGLGPPST